MRRESIAEWVLATVTEPARAATIVGDLLEEPSTREGARFWLHALRSAGSLLWKGFVSEPRFMLGLAFRAWLRMVGLGIALFLLMIVLVGLFWLFVALVALAIGGGAPWRSPASGSPHVPATSWVARALGMGVFLLIEYRIGRWIAWRAPGREMSACVTLLIFQFLSVRALTLAVALVAGRPEWMPELGTTLTSGWQAVWTSLPLFIAAFQVRRQRAVSG